jgi:hypothetical protein
MRSTELGCWIWDASDWDASDGVVGVFGKLRTRRVHGVWT